jgi:hypothetical protein
VQHAGEINPVQHPLPLGKPVFMAQRHGGEYRAFSGMVPICDRCEAAAALLPALRVRDGLLRRPLNDRFRRHEGR